MSEPFSAMENKGADCDHGDRWQNTAAIPVPVLEDVSAFYDWWARHKQILELKDRINPEIVLFGDSITHFWGGEPRAEKIQGQAVWESLFANYRVMNMGFGWDRVQNVLWRVKNGELDGLQLKAVILNIGTNNTTETENARANTAEELQEGLQAICAHILSITPDTKIILMAVLPREEHPDHPRRLQIAEINRLYEELAAKHGYTFVDIGPQLLAEDGTFPAEFAEDFIHPTEKGYQVWADAIRPLLPPTDQHNGGLRK